MIECIVLEEHITSAQQSEQDIFIPLTPIKLTFLSALLLATFLVGRRCKAEDVVVVMEELIGLYPVPAFTRRDNGRVHCPRS